MKNTILVLIALIGFYTIARNNICVFPDQIMWSSHPDIFYKVFIPLLLTASATVSLIRKDKVNIFYLSFCAMMIDAINRLSLFINNYYMFLTYGPPPPIKHSPDAIIVRTNYLPSYILLLIEIVLIVLIFRYIIGPKPLKLTTGS